MARIAIITGGASGIGKALAIAMTATGDTVVLADIDESGAIMLAEELTARDHGTALAAGLDVADAVAVAELVDKTVADHGRLDVIFNNAGIGVGGDTLELTTQHWDRIIDINLRGVVHGVQAALPHMVERGDGHIVNTASLAGLIPAPYLAPYVATKHAVVGMTLSLRAEFASRGVKFTVVCPGFTDTPILDKTPPDDLPELTSATPVREIAASLPGGIYDVEKLAQDILRGVDNDEAMVVTPAGAKAAWRGFRTSPAVFMKIITKQAASQAEHYRQHPA